MSSRWAWHGSGREGAKVILMICLYMQSRRWNQSLLIVLVNSMQRRNYCLIRLAPIGSKCDYRSSVETNSVSCYFHGNLSKSDRVEANHPTVSLISKTRTEARRHSDLLDFVFTMIFFTVIPMGVLIGNVVYIEHIQKTLPMHLKYYDREKVPGMWWTWMSHQSVLAQVFLLHCQVHDVFSFFFFIVLWMVLLINHWFVYFCCCSPLSSCSSLVLLVRIDMELRELVNHPHYLLSSLTDNALFSATGNSLWRPFAPHRCSTFVLFLVN